MASLRVSREESETAAEEGRETKRDGLGASPAPPAAKPCCCCCMSWSCCCCWAHATITLSESRNSAITRSKYDPEAEGELEEEAGRGEEGGGVSARTATWRTAGKPQQY